MSLTTTDNGYIDLYGEFATNYVSNTSTINNLTVVNSIYTPFLTPLKNVVTDANNYIITEDKTSVYSSTGSITIGNSGPAWDINLSPFIDITLIGANLTFGATGGFNNIYMPDGVTGALLMGVTGNNLLRFDTLNYLVNVPNLAGDTANYQYLNGMTGFIDNLTSNNTFIDNAIINGLTGITGNFQYIFGMTGEFNNLILPIINNNKYLYNTSLGVTGVDIVVSPNWLLSGNTGTVIGVDFIGTNDAVPFEIKTNAITHAIFNDDAIRSIRIGDIATNSMNLGYNNTVNDNNCVVVGYNNSAVDNSVIFGNNCNNPGNANGSNILYGRNILTTTGASYYNTLMGDSVASNANLVGGVCIGLASSIYANANYLIAIGYLSCFQTTGDFNIGIGFSSLENSTTSNNIAIGQDSLKINNGLECIAIGNRALQNNTGNYNLAIGSEDTLSGICSGSDLIAIGSRALKENTIGHQNIALGRDSLNNNTDGYDNISIGHYSHNLGSGENQYKNINIGNMSLRNNTENNNIAIGYQSQQSSISGFYNLSLGNESLKNNFGSYNITIGHQSGIALNDDSKFILNNSQNDLITGDFLTKQVNMSIVNITENLKVPFIGNDLWLYNTALGVTGVNLGGATGATGYTGATGPQGQTGYTGAIGATGLDGSLSAWSRLGNSGTNSSINFIGTTDAADFVIRTNNIIHTTFNDDIDKKIFAGTTGRQNLCVGVSTNGGNTENTIIGVSAFANSTIGSRSVAVGNNSLKLITTGNNNVACGSGAFSLMASSSSNNCGLGYRCGFSQTGICQDNVLIGSVAGDNLPVSISNKFQLRSNVKTLMDGDFLTQDLTLYGLLNLASGGGTCSINSTSTSSFTLNINKFPTNANGFITNHTAINTINVPSPAGDFNRSATSNSTLLRINFTFGPGIIPQQYLGGTEKRIILTITNNQIKSTSLIFCQNVNLQSVTQNIPCFVEIRPPIDGEVQLIVFNGAADNVTDDGTVHMQIINAV